ncbi:MAG TPA: hypothetical protein VHD83_19090 [Puia sp.]|nr:hypothetical protein [Puia sp.]
MAINQNHLFEELNGVKCAIVEKNVAGGRVAFLRGLLEHNGYTVVVVPSPPPKGAAAPAGAGGQTAAAGGTGISGGQAGETVPAPAPGSAPASETFTVGVTDVLFNPVNAVFGRLLRTPGGHVVTLAYWQQKEGEGSDERPYFEAK